MLKRKRNKQVYFLFFSSFMAFAVFLDTCDAFLLSVALFLVMINLTFSALRCSVERGCILKNQYLEHFIYFLVPDQLKAIFHYSGFARTSGAKLLGHAQYFSCVRISVRLGACRHAMEVEVFSTFRANFAWSDFT